MTRNVLFIPSNGTGMGHLVRQLAIARRLSSDFRPVFLCMSQVLPTLDDLDLPAENVMSSNYSRLGPGWPTYLHDRVSRLVETLAPAAVVLDASVPYEGVLRARRSAPNTPFIWSRRPMWRATSPKSQLLDGSRFTAILEPGDLADEADPGPTVSVRRFANRVGPITYLDHDELLSREEASEHLGIGSGRRAVLVSLGAGAVNDLTAVRRIVLEALVARPTVDVFLTSPMIAAEAASADHDRVRLIGEFPLARYLKAFDLCVAACGYNSAHENLVAELPTVYVPNAVTLTDDQVARAHEAARLGYAVVAPDESVDALQAAITVLDDEHRLEKMRERCRRGRRTNGAADAAAIVETLADGGDAVVTGSRRDLALALGTNRLVPFPRHRLAAASIRLKQGRLLRQLLRRPPVAPKDLLTAGDSAPSRCDGLFGLLHVGAPARTDVLDDAVAAESAALDGGSMRKPLFLTDASDLVPMSAAKLAVDHVMRRDSWERLEASVSWDEYVASRRTGVSIALGISAEDWAVL